MSDSFDSELTRQLSSLESDLGGTRLPGAAAARRRAAQRTRNQVTTGVLGSVAVIAIGILGVAQPAVFSTAPEPAAPPTDSATPTVVPSPSTSSDPTGGPTDGPTERPSADDSSQPERDSVFLSSDDLEARYDGAEGAPEWERATGDTWLPCVPAMPENAQARSFATTAETPGDQRVDQFVEEPATDQAQARLDAIRRAVEECTRNEQNDANLSSVWSLPGVGDEAYLMVYDGPPRDDQIQTYVTASLVRTGGRVTSVFDGMTGREYINAPLPDLAVAAAERLCATTQTDCSRDVGMEQIHPEPDGDVADWLTTDDIVAATGLDQITDASSPSEVTAGDASGWAHVGLPRDPMGDGAQSLRTRSYSATGIDGIAIDEMIAQFPDAESAKAHYTELVAAANEFEQKGSDITRTGTVDGDGYEATTWRMEDNQYDSVFVYGAVVSDDTVAAVMYSDGLTDEQMTDLLDRAGAALAE